MLTGLLRPQLASVNMVNAPALAKQRNIDVRVVTSETVHDYQTLLTVEVVTERGPRAVSGTLFQDAEPRLVSIRGIPVEARLGPHMLYVRNQDKPGLIGALGKILGDARDQHRDLPSRPRPARRRRHRPGRGRRPDPGARSWPRSARCRRCCTPSS